MSEKAIAYSVRYEAKNKYDDSYTETRYRIVDTDTGEILDDAQGYGYKTAQKAHAAWSFKRAGGYSSQLLAAGEWLEKHHKVQKILDEEAFLKIKDPANDGVTVVLCQKLMDEIGETYSFTAKDLLKAWEKDLVFSGKRGTRGSRKKTKGSTERELPGI